MKKNQIKFAILLFLVNIYSYSQANLQFNNVITDFGNIVGNANSEVNSPAFTVPTGKVWKLERWLRNFLVINGVRITDQYSVAGTSTPTIAIDNAPIWLKAGDYFYFIQRESYPFTLRYYFSALEFNID